MILDWLFRNWMYAGFIAGVLLLAVLLSLLGVVELPLLLIYLQLPLYMIHQLEEHAGDRFRTFVNDQLAGGRDALTTLMVVIVNIPFVWGIDLVAIFLARYVSLGLGLIAVYLMIVNGIVHAVASFFLRIYNPGLVTAVLVFLPVGIATAIIVSVAPGVGIDDHLIGLAVALAIHAFLVVHVKTRARHLEAMPVPVPAE